MKQTTDDLYSIDNERFHKDFNFAMCLKSEVFQANYIKQQNLCENL